MGATREESHALAIVLRDDDIIDNKPIRRGQGVPACMCQSVSCHPLAPRRRSPGPALKRGTLLDSSHEQLAIRGKCLARAERCVAP